MIKILLAQILCYSRQKFWNSQKIVLDLQKNLCKASTMLSTIMRRWPEYLLHRSSNDPLRFTGKFDIYLINFHGFWPLQLPPVAFLRQCSPVCHLIPASVLEHSSCERFLLFFLLGIVKPPNLVFLWNTCLEAYTIFDESLWYVSKKQTKITLGCIIHFTMRTIESGSQWFFHFIWYEIHHFFYFKQLER